MPRRNTKLDKYRELYLRRLSEEGYPATIKEKKKFNNEFYNETSLRKTKIYSQVRTSLLNLNYAIKVSVSLDLLYSCIR